jgi:hypothetical protein
MFRTQTGVPAACGSQAEHWLSLPAAQLPTKIIPYLRSKLN